MSAEAKAKWDELDANQDGALEGEAPIIAMDGSSSLTGNPSGTPGLGGVGLAQLPPGAGDYRRGPSRGGAQGSGEV